MAELICSHNMRAIGAWITHALLGDGQRAGVSCPATQLKLNDQVTRAVGLQNRA
jgi:hypothetical protein